MMKGKMGKMKRSASNGHKRVTPSESGTAIPRGTEVVITQYKNGLVYVRPWADLAREHELASQATND